MRIGVGVLLAFCTLSLTPILPITPGISCPEANVSNLIGYRINNTALAQLPAPHRQHITYRRFDRLSLSFHFCSAADWG